MNTPVKSGVGTSSAPGHTDLKEDPIERELDEALADTFPASDPIAVTPEDAPQRAPDAAISEPPEDTSPASDPPAPARPGMGSAAQTAARHLRTDERRRGQESVITGTTRRSQSQQNINT